MEFGQTLDPLELGRLQFSLPPLQSPEEEAQLTRLKKAAARIAQDPRIFVGTPIFNFPGWVGNFFPEGTETTDYLRAYSKQLSTVEVNSTFYAIPSAEIFQKWKASVSGGFKFCPKFPKSVSHSLDPTHADLKLFLERVLLLGENLGVCFLQLPHYFSSREGERLLTLLSSLPRELRTVVELRNPDFFINQRLKPEWVDKFASRFVGAVSVDTPLERGVAHVSFTSTRTMVRFLGANLHDTDFTRLKEWSKRIVNWHLNGMKEIYFLIHEPDNGLAPMAARKMLDLINEELIARSSATRVPVMEWHALW